MNYSKKYLIFLFLVTLGFVQSCDEDRLNVDPVNEQLSSNFFRTEGQIFEALVAAYDPAGWSIAFGNWVSYVMFGEIRSDNARAGGDPSNNDQPGWQEFDDFTNTNTNTITQPIYRKNYIGIFRANTVINQTQVSSPLVDRFVAEAKFLRAYFHFELFKHFGPIPVVTELLAPSEVNLSRNTMSEVFQQITTDLEEAAEELPISVSPAEAGRATRGAALSLLGRAYLYWADMSDDDPARFDLAAAALQQVVDLGVYQLEDDLQTLFNLGSVNTGEAVFEIQHNSIWTSDWSFSNGIDGNAIIQLCGIRGLCSDHPFYDAGWGFMMPTESLFNHFLPDDEYRRDVAIATEDELRNDIEEAGFSCNVVVDRTQSNPIDFTGFWQEKFANFKAHLGTNINGGDPNLTKSQNTHPIRYADVLLMLAEAIVRGNGSDSEAFQHIDIVRERAAGPGDNSGTFRNAQTVLADEGWTLLDLIRYERRAEFALEGDRWFDLVRTGRVNANLWPNDDLRSNNFSDQHLWLPIALEETNVAPNLTTFPDASLFE